MKNKKEKVIIEADLVYGKKYGITKAEAKKQYIKGFKEEMDKDKHFWKDKKVIFK